MGILDSKSRILDTVITNEGRRQLASGKMKIEYYTFTDVDVFYSGSSDNVALDASTRLYFEAPSTLPSDSITFEADDSGLLKFDNRPDLNVVNGNINKTTVIGDSINTEFLTGTAFASEAATLLTSSIDSFKNLKVISTIDRLFGDDDEFYLSSNSGKIELNESTKLFKRSQNTLTIDAINIPDFISDVKLSRSINFQFLPPTIPLPVGVSMDSLTRTEQRNYSLGQYENFSPSPLATKSKTILNGTTFSLEDKNVNNNTNNNGFIYSKNNGFSKKIDFKSSPQSKKMVMQVFEIISGKNQVRKLDVIDAGLFDFGLEKMVQVYFVGRVIYNHPRYVFANIFTLVFNE